MGGGLTLNRRLLKIIPFPNPPTVYKKSWWNFTNTNKIIVHIPFLKIELDFSPKDGLLGSLFIKKKQKTATRGNVF